MTGPALDSCQESESTSDTAWIPGLRDWMIQRPQKEPDITADKESQCNDI